MGLCNTTMPWRHFSFSPDWLCWLLCDPQWVWGSPFQRRIWPPFAHSLGLSMEHGCILLEILSGLAGIFWKQFTKKCFLEERFRIINKNLIGNHGLVIAEDKLFPALHVHFQQILLGLRSMYSQTVSDYWNNTTKFRVKPVSSKQTFDVFKPESTSKANTSKTGYLNK